MNDRTSASRAKAETQSGSGRQSQNTGSTSGAGNAQPGNAPSGNAPSGNALSANAPSGIRHWLISILKPKSNGNGNGETLAELIEESQDAEALIDDDQRVLVQNILQLRDRTIYDVMVPRVDIIAVDSKIPLNELVDVMTREGHSRIPVYRDTLDDAIGMIHIKDLLSNSDADIKPVKLVRKVLFVAPSMKVLELLLEMRVTRCHMALVVDEFGGIDGLVTIEDLVEEIVGEIEDEHDVEETPDLLRRADGVIEADARTPLEDLEAILGPLVNDEEREDIDTIGGLVFSLAGHIPIRGELVLHPAGVEFQVTEADPRRIRRLRIRAAENGDSLAASQ